MNKTQPKSSNITSTNMNKNTNQPAPQTSKNNESNPQTTLINTTKSTQAKQDSPQQHFIQKPTTQMNQKDVQPLAAGTTKPGTQEPQSNQQKGPLLTNTANTNQTNTNTASTQANQPTATTQQVETNASSKTQAQPAQLTHQTSSSLATQTTPNTPTLQANQSSLPTPPMIGTGTNVAPALLTHQSPVMNPGALMTNTNPQLEGKVNAKVPTKQTMTFKQTELDSGSLAVANGANKKKLKELKNKQGNAATSDSDEFQQEQLIIEEHHFAKYVDDATKNVLHQRQKDKARQEQLRRKQQQQIKTTRKMLEKIAQLQLNDKIIIMLQRKTVISTVLLKTLESAAQPLSVNQLLTALQEKDLAPNKTTIYRILTKLQKNNQISEIKTTNGTAFFELKKRSHHHHFICNSCETIFCLNQCHLDALSINLKSLLPNENFIPQSHEFNIYGVCEPCAKK